MIAEAMTLSEMTVLATDEILLRSEISGIEEEGTRRAASKRIWWVRPRQARPSRMTPRDFTSEQFRRVDTRRVGARRSRAALGARRPNGSGVGTAATSAALPHDAARFHFGTVPPG